MNAITSEMGGLIFTGTVTQMVLDSLQSLSLIVFLSMFAMRNEWKYWNFEYYQNSKLSGAFFMAPEKTDVKLYVSLCMYEKFVLQYCAKKGHRHEKKKRKSLQLP